MIIEELKIGKFAGFENKTFNFTQGINLIEGENESGKSSIAEFIRFIFYGVKDEIQSENAPLYGYLVLSCGKGRFRIERSFAMNGDLPDGRVTIIDLQINAPLKGRDPAAMFLGVPADIFERSCFFSQFGARDVGGRALSAALENMLSSADEQINAEKSAEQLSLAIALLKGEEGEDGAQEQSLPMLLKEKEELSARHERAVSMEQEYRRTAESYAENKKKVEGNKKALEECRALLGHSDALQKLERIKRANEAKERLEACRSKLEELKTAATENDFLPDTVYVKNIRALAEKCRRHEEAALEKKQEYTLQKEEYDGIPQPPSGREGALLEKVAKAGADAQMHNNYFLFCLAGAGLFLLLTLLFAVLKVVAGAIITAVLAVAAGVGAVLQKRKAQEKENALYALAGAENREGLARAVEEWARCTERRAGLEKQMEETLRKQEKAEQERNATLAEGAQMAAQWGKPCGTVESLTLLAKHAQTLVEHLGALENEEKQLRLEYADWQISYTPQELQGLIDTVRAMSTREQLPPEEYKKVKMKVNFYDQTSRALEERMAKQERQMAELEETMEDRHLLAHRLKMLEERITKTEERIRVLTLARDAILAAVSSMREKILPGILEDASAFLEAASAGRYTGLLTNEAFALSVKDGKTGEQKKVEQLSAAMGDLAYISLRMAVTRRLYGEKEPLLMVFDESFTHLDDLHLASLFMALAERSGQWDLQIFFMTCRKREAALLEKIAKVNKISL